MNTLLETQLKRAKVAARLFKEYAYLHKESGTR